MSSIETKVTVHSDRATGIASSAFGANTDVLAFNLALIQRLKPQAAIDLLRLYNELKSLSDDQPDAPEEDFDSALSR